MNCQRQCCCTGGKRRHLTGLSRRENNLGDAVPVAQQNWHIISEPLPQQNLVSGVDMSSVPQPCQSLADQVSKLKSQDQALRAKLTNFAGADAWGALAQLGQLREQMNVAQGQLDACISHNSAALQANLIIMDVGGARIRHLRA